MSRLKGKYSAYLLVFIFAVLLFLSRIFESANIPDLFAGMPVSFIYIFGGWFMVILALAFLSRINKDWKHD